jgi:manganese/iron transport system ATP-binding protein
MMTQTPSIAFAPHTAPVTANALLRAHDVTVSYGSGALALDCVSFSVQRGESVAIIGPNGAGKSTLIKAILGQLPLSNGEFHIESASRLPLGYVPQHEGINLSFPVTARDVVLMGRTRQIGWLRMPSKRDWAAADDALARVGMADFRHRQIGELSGGQRRRVFIARALAQNAEILLLDEPMSGVDAGAQIDLMNVLDDLTAQGLTILLSTHDLELAISRFQKVMALRRRLIAFGDPASVYRAEVLTQLYDRALTTWSNGAQTSLIIDEHGCPNC